MQIDRSKIIEAKDKLDLRNAFIMAEELRLDNFDEKNLKACCPYHNENTPSFIYNPKSHQFHCFGCQATVDVIDVYMQNGRTYNEAVKELFDKAGINYSFGELNVRTRYQYTYPHEEPLNDREHVNAYAGLRGISPETLDHADVREDAHGNAVFNYYDTNDVLTMIKYRPSHKINKDAGEIKNWCQKGADTTPLLFNMNRVNIDQPLLITEGEYDTLSAIESGYPNTVSVPFGAGNFGWIEENWKWLEQFKTIIICGDNDEPGFKMQKECIYRLGSWRTKIINIPPYIEADGKKYAVKDLNDVLYRAGKQAVLDLIHNAQDSPIPSLVDFSDVVDIDVSDVDGIYTGIKPLDTELLRMFYSSVTLLTGTPGSGKSSFLYQLIAEAVDQKQMVWLFSREMPVHMSKNWMLSIFAGGHNVIRYETQQGASYYKVSAEAKSLIDKKYKGMIHMYRDGYSNSIEDVKQSMEDSVRKFGCKLFIIDNLMTVNLHSSDDNKYDKQTELLTYLIDFANRYNVCVVLVAHPKKKLDADSTAINKYDISGSSNMINLAHRSLGLRRVTEKEKSGVPNAAGTAWKIQPVPYDVILTVIKDRLRGREGIDIGLYYDKATRRFFTDEQEFNRQYSWDTNQYTQKLVYPVTDRNDLFAS